MLVLNGGDGTLLHPIHGLYLLIGRVKALSSKLSLIDVVAHEEVTLGGGPVGEAIVGHPAGMWLRTEVHYVVIHFGILNEPETVFFKRLVILIELGHVKGELIIVSIYMPC